MTQTLHVDDPTESRHGMIIGGYLLMGLGLDTKFYKDTIEVGIGKYEGYATPISN